MTRDELGKRLRAAIAYSGKTDTEVGKALGKNGPDTVRSWKGGNFPDANRAILLKELSEILGVPLEWFTASLDHLHLVPSVDEVAEAEFRHITAAEVRRVRGLPERRCDTERRAGDRRLGP